MGNPPIAVLMQALHLSRESAPVVRQVLAEPDLLIDFEPNTFVPGTVLPPQDLDRVGFL